MPHTLQLATRRDAKMATKGPGAAPAAVAVPPTTVGLHGAFDPAVEEWMEYVERLSHYFEANDITSEGKKRAILLNAVGPSTYWLIKTLASPARVTELSFEELVEKASAHFGPKPSLIVKRYESNTRVQGEGESIAQKLVGTVSMVGY